MADENLVDFISKSLMEEFYDSNYSVFKSSNRMKIEDEIGFVPYIRRVANENQFSQQQFKDFEKAVRIKINLTRTLQKTAYISGMKKSFPNQKFLVEHLQRERTSFPRFHFVGDEDLLEILGNHKNIPRLQKHFQKIFTGVATIIFNEENNIVLGIASREGEEVRFKTPVSTVEYPKVSEWLTQVEKEMRVTLAQHLADAVRDIRQFKEGLIDQPAFMSWCDKYEAQIVVLAAQIMWSEDIEAALQAVSSAGDNSLVPVQRVLAQVESTLTVLAENAPSVFIKSSFYKS